MQRWDEPQLMNAAVWGTTVTFRCSLEGGRIVRRENRPCGSTPGVNLLCVTNFTLRWEKSAETLEFSACHILLLDTKRLIHFADNAYKQLHLPNALHTHSPARFKSDNKGLQLGGKMSLQITCTQRSARCTNRPIWMLKHTIQYQHSYIYFGYNGMGPLLNTS